MHNLISDERLAENLVEFKASEVEGVRTLSHSRFKERKGFVIHETIRRDLEGMLVVAFYI